MPASIGLKKRRCVMRLGSRIDSGNDYDELFRRLIGSDQGTWPAGAWQVPTDVFHSGNSLVIRMDLPDVDPNEVEVAVQESTLLINGSRKFPYDAEKVRFVRRGTFYGDFTQRVNLGKGLDVDKVNARYDSGVLELTIPYAEEVQPKKISIEVGSEGKQKVLNK
jgi:HSP20 family protein